MGALLDFFYMLGDAIVSFFSSLIEAIKLVAVAYRIIPSYAGVFGGIFAAWIVAGLGCCVVFRIIGRE